MASFLLGSCVFRRSVQNPARTRHRHHRRHHHHRHYHTILVQSLGAYVSHFSILKFYILSLSHQVN